MTNKSIGHHIYGPEDRIVSAKLGNNSPTMMVLPNPFPYRSIVLGNVAASFPAVPGITNLHIAVRPGTPQYLAEYDRTFFSGVVQYEWTVNFQGVVHEGVTPIASGLWFVEPGSYNWDWFRTPDGTTVVGTTTQYVGGDDLSPTASANGVTVYSMPYFYNLSIQQATVLAQSLYDEYVAEHPEANSYNYVVSSSGDILAIESQDAVGDWVHKDLAYVLGSTLWSGAGYADMYYYSDNNYYGDRPGQGLPTIKTYTFNHKLTFTVPEDCIYPEQPIPPPYVGVAATGVLTVVTQPTFGQYVSVTTITGPGGTRVINGFYSSELIVTDEGSYTIATIQNFPGLNPGIPLPTSPVKLYSGTFDQRTGYTYTDPSIATYTEYQEASAANPAQATHVDDWLAAQVELGLRRRAWFQKNSDTLLQNIRSGSWQLPTKWDYLIKKSAPRSLLTRRAILMNVVYEDTLVSDTTENTEGVPGTIVMSRKATFSYNFPVGEDIEERTYTVTGTKTTVLSQHMSNGDPWGVSKVDTYVNWSPGAAEYWAPSTVYEGNAQVIVALEESLPHRLLLDGNPSRGFGMGLLWTGSVVNGYAPDTTFFYKPGYTQIGGNSIIDYLGLDPAYPTYSNTLVGDTFPFMREYLAAVPVKVGTFNAQWNDSALVSGQTVRIILFGPEGRGIFGKWEGTDTTIQVYGAVTLLYTDGVFSFKSWTTPKQPNRTETINEVEVVSRIVPMPNGGVGRGEFLIPQGSDFSNLVSNALVEYINPKWSDVQMGAKEFKKDENSAGIENSIYLTILNAMK